MQNIIIEKPYKFVPPHRGTWWPSFIRFFNLQGLWLRKAEGVASWECRHVERLRASLDEGHGIMLAPNHCRYADPIVMGWLTREANCHVYAMASWHLFNQGWFNAFAIRRMGGFSVNREGVDRKAIDTAIEILENAERPLVVFPEGAVTRTNDQLHALLDGVPFIARAAATRRATRGAGRVVIHPVGLKYLFSGDIHEAADKVLQDIERRFSWRPQRHLPLMDRITKVGKALLCLKEFEYFGAAQNGRLADRMQGLIDRLLQPLEREWLGCELTGPVVPRVKALRIKIFPDMISGNITAAERDRRWGQLADIYLAQQVSCYPPDYLVERPSVDRVLETIERFEEDLTDKARVHGRLKVIIEVGEAIEVSPHRDKSAAVDPLMARLEQDLQAMLDRLALESPLLEPPVEQTTGLLRPDMATTDAPMSP